MNTRTYKLDSVFNEGTFRNQLWNSQEVSSDERIMSMRLSAKIKATNGRDDEYGWFSVVYGRIVNGEYQDEVLGEYMIEEPLGTETFDVSFTVYNSNYDLNSDEVYFALKFENQSVASVNHVYGTVSGTISAETEIENDSESKNWGWEFSGDFSTAKDFINVWGVSDTVDPDPEDYYGGHFQVVTGKISLMLNIKNETSDTQHFGMFWQEEAGSAETKQVTVKEQEFSANQSGTIKIEHIFTANDLVDNDYPSYYYWLNLGNHFSGNYYGNFTLVTKSLDEVISLGVDRNAMQDWIKEKASDDFSSDGSTLDDSDMQDLVNNLASEGYSVSGLTSGTGSEIDSWASSYSGDGYSGDIADVQSDLYNNMSVTTDMSSHLAELEARVTALEKQLDMYEGGHDGTDNYWGDGEWKESDTEVRKMKQSEDNVDVEVTSPISAIYVGSDSKNYNTVTLQMQVSVKNYNTSPTTVMLAVTSNSVDLQTLISETVDGGKFFNKVVTKTLPGTFFSSLSDNWGILLRSGVGIEGKVTGRVISDYIEVE